MFSEDDQWSKNLLPLETSFLEDRTHIKIQECDHNPLSKKFVSSLNN